MMKTMNIPGVISTQIPLQHCYSEYTQTTLEDLRSMMRYHFDNSIESYYAEEIPKIHRKCIRKGLKNPTIRIEIHIYLFNQRKDKEVYSKNMSFDLRFYGAMIGVRASNVIGLEPKQIRDIDEMLLPILHEDDEYLNKWDKLHPEV